MPRIMVRPAQDELPHLPRRVQHRHRRQRRRASRRTGAGPRLCSAPAAGDDSLLADGRVRIELALLLDRPRPR